MCVVLEIATIRVTSCTKPIISDTNVETADAVGEGEVELLGVITVHDTNATPSCERLSFVANTESWLESRIATVGTTPDVITYYIG